MFGLDVTRHSVQEVGWESQHNRDTYHECRPIGDWVKKRRKPGLREYILTDTNTDIQINKVNARNAQAQQPFVFGAPFPPSFHRTR